MGRTGERILIPLGIWKEKANAPSPGSQQTATREEICNGQGMQRAINRPAA